MKIYRIANAQVKLYHVNTRLYGKEIEKQKGFDPIITVPDAEWEISWNGVGAAKYKGVIGSEDVMVVG